MTDIDLQSHIAAVRDLVAEDTANFWTDNQMARLANREHTKMCRALAAADPGLLAITSYISQIASQEAYDLPAFFSKLVDVRRKVSTSDDIWIMLSPIDIRDRSGNREPSTPGIYAEHYYLLGDTIGFLPVPAEGNTNNVELLYVRDPADMHYATASAGAAGSITFPASATAGNVSVRDDYYNNVDVYIISGTGAGQKRTISDYDGATRVASVSSNWDTNPDNTSIYSIMPMIPEQFVETWELGTAIRALRTEEASAPGIAQMNADYQLAWHGMMRTIADRQSQLPTYVRQTDTEWD